MSMPVVTNLSKPQTSQPGKRQDHLIKALKEKTAQIVLPTCLLFCLTVFEQYMITFNIQITTQIIQSVAYFSFV